MTLASVSPVQGSVGGGFVLTLSGKSLDAMTSSMRSTPTTVTVCGSPCTSIETSSSTEMTCTVAETQTAESCDVVLSQDGTNVTLSSAFEFRDDLTPKVTSVSPDRGGTAGGTVLTITGTGKRFSRVIKGGELLITNFFS